MIHPQYMETAENEAAMSRSRFKRAWVGSITVIALAMQAGPCAAQPQLPLTLVRDIPLPGAASRFDYLSLDPQTGLLFIAHLGTSQVVVFDTGKQRVIATIERIDKVHGVLAIPSLKRVYASATGTNEIVAFDERTGQLAARISGGAYPDGLSYAPEFHKLFVSDEFGRTLTIIDVDKNRRIATLELGGEIGNNQYDPVSRHVLVNVQSLRQLVEVDARTHQVTGRHALSGCDSNHGLLIIPDERLALIACEDNAMLPMLDLRTMRVAHKDTVGRTPDVLAFDAAQGRLYVASESGVVSVFQVAPSGLVKEGEAWIAPRAHSILVDPRTHLVYLPIQDVNGRPVLRIMRPR